MANLKQFLELYNECIEQARKRARSLDLFKNIRPFEGDFHSFGPQPDLFGMPTITCDGSCENPKDCIEKKICAQKCNKELPKIVKEQKLICDLTYEDYKPGIEKVMPSLFR